ncbi:MAG: hypothetical protein ACI8Z1_003964 [Candidatus Azotimanducaceae bacterium]|jgi:hypothetical protein
MLEKGSSIAKAIANDADSMIGHRKVPAKYIREVSLPAIETGLLISPRTLRNFLLDCSSDGGIS